MVQNTTIEEFQELLRKKYKENTSLEEAREILFGMVAYYDLLAKIDYRRRLALEKHDLALQEN